MAVTITNTSLITVSGGTATNPLLLTHLVNVANYPAGTTQATVDSYITRTPNSYTFTVKAGKKINVVGGLDMSDATVRHEAVNSHFVANGNGVIIGGKIVGGKIYGRTTWIFDNGCQSIPDPGATGSSFLAGNSIIDMKGLRIINNSQQPGATGGHTGINFVANGGGYFNLVDLELLCEGNVPTYATFNGTNTSSSVSIKEARVAAIRHSTNLVKFSFSPNGGGWIGGDGGSGNNKFLTPINSIYNGFEPVFQKPTDIMNITTPSFGSPSVTFTNSFVDVNRIAMYPNATGNLTRIQRKLTFNIINLTGAIVNNMRIRGVSQRVVTTNAVAGVVTPTQVQNVAMNYGGSNLVTVWSGAGARGGTGDGTYLLPNIITDDRTIDFLIRTLDHYEQVVSTSGEFGEKIFTNALVPDPYYTADRSAFTGISIVAGTKTITLSQAYTIDELYDFIKGYLMQSPIMQVPNFITPSGKILDVFGGWKMEGVEFLSNGTKLQYIKCAGNLYASGAVKNLNVIGDIYIAPPTDLLNVNIDGVLFYNQNTPIQIGLVMSKIKEARNNGSEVVTITKDETSWITTYTDAEINFIDSEISTIGTDSVTIYATENDRRLGINAGAVILTSQPFKYNGILQGVLMSGTVYLTAKVGEVELKAEKILQIGSNVIDYGVQGQLEMIKADLKLKSKETTLLSVEKRIVDKNKLNLQPIKINTDLIPLTI